MTRMARDRAKTRRERGNPVHNNSDLDILVYALVSIKKVSEASATLDMV
jgi:hypothetical protein